MKTTLPLLPLTALLLGAGAALGEDPAAAPPHETVPPDQESASSVGKGANDRMPPLSFHLERLRLASETPPAPAPSTPQVPPAGGTVANAGDASSDSVIYLDPVVVELPPPVLRPEDVATAKGGALAARELHFTGEVDRILNTITLPLVGRTPEQRSLDRQREAARLAHLDETAHMAAVLERSDPAGASELREHLHQVALHDNAFRDDLPPALRREAR